MFLVVIGGDVPFKRGEWGKFDIDISVSAEKLKEINDWVARLKVEADTFDLDLATARFVEYGKLQVRWTPKKPLWVDWV